MGNQNVKPGKRSSQGTVYPFAEPEKKSRTDWTAGNSVGLFSEMAAFIPQNKMNL